MDNQKDHTMYQVPAPKHGESFDAPAPAETQDVSSVLTDEAVRQRFDDIAREEIARAYNEITQDLEMSLSGYETRKQPQVEVLSQHPVAMELLDIGNNIERYRAEYLDSFKTAKKNPLKKVAGKLLGTNAKGPAPSYGTLVDRESRHATKIFPKDADVSTVKFFYLPDERGTPQWFHEQHSHVPAKKFTNTYTVSEYAIAKSSTYFDPRYNKFVNSPAYVSDQEAQNLLYASKKYYEEVTGKPYVKLAAPRLRPEQASEPVKSDFDLAA
jgi:hypothetical protein